MAAVETVPPVYGDKDKHSAQATPHTPLSAPIVRNSSESKSDPDQPQLQTLQKENEKENEIETEKEEKEFEKRLLRKIDWHIIPWLSLLYLLSFLDRANIGNARLYNLEHDLRITDTQYRIALTVFFFPYAVFEMPSNVLLKRLRPSRWLSFLMVVWGIIMTLHGVITNYHGLVALRVLLGLFEAGLYPGVAFYLTCWYKRSELGTRVAIFFSAATVSGAFGGLLAAAISSMHGVGSKPGWAWIFILEGLFTVLVGVASFWVVQDFPEEARFLSRAERKWVIDRLRADQQFSVGAEKFDMRYVRQAITDKKTWICLGIYMGLDGPLFAFSLFTPTIINELGFESTAANLLSVPVYAWACLVTCVVGVLGDRYREGNRAYINLGLLSIGMIGYVILLASRNAPLSYFAVYLAASGIYATIPNTLAWVSSNTEGSYKRSAVLGILIGWGNLNGAVSSNVYRATDAPWYPLGHGIVLAYIAIGWTSTLALRFVLRAENARRERGERDEEIRVLGLDVGDLDKTEGISGVDAADAVSMAAVGGRISTKEVFGSVSEARVKKGDEWSGFRYSL